MKNACKMFLFLLFSMLSIGYSKNINACTGFSFTISGKIYVAKNYDWLVNHGHGYALLSPRNILRIAFNPNLKENTPFNWHSKYGSITFSQFGKGFPASGINEKRLVVEILELENAQYPGADPNRGVNEAQWAQYQLDNYATTFEVIKNLDTLPITKAYIGVHYLITDASGDTAIIEFLKGKPVAYHGDNLSIAALTNSPYQDLEKYLSSHTDEKCPASIWRYRTSENRFCTVAKMLEQYKNTPIEGTAAAFNILEMASLNGTSYDAYGEPTQWSIVHNLTENIITFKTRGANKMKTININNIDFKTLNSIKYFNMNSLEFGDITSKFIDFTDSNNKSLIEENYYLLWIKWLAGWGWIDTNAAANHGIKESKG